jgi:hypothetical protein
MSTPGTPNNQAIPYFTTNLLAPNWHISTKAIGQVEFTLEQKKYLFTGGITALKPN